MNQRIAIAISGTTAVAVLAIGMSAAGLTPRFPGSEGVAASDSATEVAVLATSAEVAAGPTAEPTIKPKVVYVKPAPKRRTVVVTKPARQRNATASRSTSRASTSKQSAPRRRADQQKQRDHDRHEREDREDREDHEDREREHERDDD